MRFCGQAPSAREGGFQVENFLANLGVGIAKFQVFLSNSSTFATYLPVFRNTSAQCMAVRLLAFPKQAAVGSFGASGSVCQAAEHSTRTRNNYVMTGNVG